MSIPLELTALRVRLQDAGIVVVEEPDHLTVRLPFFCSIQVRLIDGRLKLDAFYSLMPRMRATIVRFIMLAALSTGAIKIGMQWSIGFATVAILAGLLDVMRWVVSENAITKIQIIWSMMERADVPRHELGEGAGISYTSAAMKDRVR